MNVPNVLSYFMELRPKVKMTLIICVTIPISIFIGMSIWASVQTGSFTELMKLTLEKIFN